MTSRLDYLGEQGFMVADGLPSNFGGLLEIVRAVDDAVSGWRGLLLRVKRLATHFGLSDQQITYRHLRPSTKRPIDDSLVFLMIGRAAADGQMRLTPLLKCFDIRWSRQGSEALFAAMEKVTDRARHCGRPRTATWPPTAKISRNRGFARTKTGRRLQRMKR